MVVLIDQVLTYATKAFKMRWVNNGALLQTVKFRIHFLKLFPETFWIFFILQCSVPRNNNFF